MKDYADLAQLHFEFPNLRLSYNIVPSLLIQLDEYEQGVDDRVLALAAKAAEQLTAEDKAEILLRFFRCQHQRMLHPYERFRELFEQSQDREKVMAEWSEQDWRDVQVWYTLTWTGPLSRQLPALHALFKKGKNYSEQDKFILLAQHRLILRSVVPTLRELHRIGMAELSVSPLYHPILPLIIDTDSAKEATPELPLPQKRYRQQHDAAWQVQRGMQVFEEHLSTSAKGMWCSEGSLSDETMDVLREAGLQWTATDEDVLRATRGSEFRDGDQYFVHYHGAERRRPIAVFFRDHALSDAIGFVYQQWQAHDAVADFVGRLTKIRSMLIDTRGEECLREAVVPIILDGENCWEFYEDNGLPFLRALYAALSSDPELQTVHFRDVVHTEAAKALASAREEFRLSHLRAGSWIYANFRIWIGQDEKNAAWDALHAARLLVDAKRVNRSQWKVAMEHIYIAEGSDWFWWYGDDHRAEDRPLFDEIFRYHLRKVYEIYREEIPSVLRTPIMKSQQGPGSGYSAMHRIVDPD